MHLACRGRKFSGNDGNGYHDVKSCYSEEMLSSYSIYCYGRATTYVDSLLASHPRICFKCWLKYKLTASHCYFPTCLVILGISYRLSWLNLFPLVDAWLSVSQFFQARDHQPWITHVCLQHWQTLKILKLWLKTCQRKEEQTCFWICAMMFAPWMIVECSTVLLHCQRKSNVYVMFRVLCFRVSALVRLSTWLHGVWSDGWGYWMITQTALISCEVRCELCSRWFDLTRLIGWHGKCWVGIGEHWFLKAQAVLRKVHAGSESSGDSSDPDGHDRGMTDRKSCLLSDLSCCKILTEPLYW